MSTVIIIMMNLKKKTKPMGPNVISALGTVPKDLEWELGELEIRRPAEIIQTTALSRSIRILRKVVVT